MKKVFFSARYMTIGILALTLFDGCARKEQIKVEHIQRNAIHTKPYQLKITPIVGTRQDDAKVIMDMGKVIKVWIAPYKDKKTFVSAHDNYVVAKAPDFVVGETMPQKNWRGIVGAEKKVPFLFRDADLDNASKLEEEEIVQYNNNVYKQQNDENESKKRLEEVDVFDKEIKEFLVK